MAHAAKSEASKNAPKQKRKKKASHTRERTERRFLPERHLTPIWIVVLGMLGALTLGAGVYGQWVLEEPPSYATYLVVAGAIALAVALWFGDTKAIPIRVGEAGLAVEKGSELVRLAWCDIKRIWVDKGQLFAKGGGLTLSVPVGAHPTAVAWVLSEGVRRVPDALDVKREEVEALPKPKDTDGESVAIIDVQVAGRHCAESGTPISMERDARLCPNCAQVYHYAHVPKACVTCKTKLPGRAYRP